MDRYKSKGGASPPKTEHENPGLDPVALGREAWGRRKNDVKASWEDWKAIGVALTIGRQEAMEKAGAEKPEGKNYTQAYSDWLQLHGFDEIDKSDRAKLLNLIDDVDCVERWRATLTEPERQRLNSPSAVWRRYENKGSPRRAHAAHKHSESVTRKVGTSSSLDIDPDTDLTEIIAEVERAGHFADQLGKRRHNISLGLLAKVEATANKWRQANESLLQRLPPRVQREEPTSKTLTVAIEHTKAEPREISLNVVKPAKSVH